MDVEAQQAFLDNNYGTTAGPHAPDGFEVACFFGDPILDGVEIDDETEVDDGLGGTEMVPNGYERFACDQADFLDTDEFGVKTTVTLTGAVPLEAWETITHLQLFDPVTGKKWGRSRLAKPREITGAGDAPTFVIEIFFNFAPSTEPS